MHFFSSIAKVETTTEAEAVRQQQSSIQNLVTKVMQSGNTGTGSSINEVTKPATLTITPVGSSSTTTTTTTSSGPVIQMVANSPIPELKRMRSQVSVRDHHEQPDTTESLD